MTTNHVLLSVEGVLPGVTLGNGVHERPNALQVRWHLPFLQVRPDSDKVGCRLHSLGIASCHLCSERALTLMVLTCKADNGGSVLKSCCMGCRLDHRAGHYMAKSLCRKMFIASSGMDARGLLR